VSPRISRPTERVRLARRGKEIADIDALIRMILKEDQRQHVEALRPAVIGLLYRAEDALA
jgi:hypothetical protein